MDILFTRRNIDEIPADAVALTICSDERPLQGESGLIDWRMNGYISRQLQSNRITGKLGETVLIPGPTRIHAKKLFIFGMGETESIDEEKVNTVSEHIKKTLDGMKKTKFAFVLSRNIKDRNKFNRHLKTFFSNFITDLDGIVSSVYFHYEKKEEKESLYNLKNQHVKLFEEKIGSA